MALCSNTHDNEHLFYFLTTSAINLTESGQDTHTHPQAHTHRPYVGHSKVNVVNSYVNVVLGQYSYSFNGC